MNSIICVLCNRDIDDIGQDNMSSMCDTPICEDCYFDENNLQKIDSILYRVRTVVMTYEDFCKLKSLNYSYNCLKKIACKYLNCKVDDIDDIDFNYKLKFDVYLKHNGDKEC